MIVNNNSFEEIKENCFIANGDSLELLKKSLSIQKL